MKNSTPAKDQRKPYRAPALVTHGDVKTLTQCQIYGNGHGSTCTFKHVS